MQQQYNLTLLRNQKLKNSLEKALGRLKSGEGFDSKNTEVVETTVGETAVGETAVGETIKIHQTTSPNEPKNPEKWKILGFANRRYKDIAEIWYEQMTALGYTEHYVAALDNNTFVKFQNLNFRVILAEETEFDRMKKEQVEAGVDGAAQGWISGLWLRRLRTAADQMRQGYNVFISDVDTGVVL